MLRAVNFSGSLGQKQASSFVDSPGSVSLSVNSGRHIWPDIAGYSIVEQLYSGSRTAVYRAVQIEQQCPVVMKVLRREHPSFAELVQFRNQYTIAKNLPIAGIVHPLSLEPLGSGYALVMEDFGGIALGKYVQQRSLPLDAVLEIALQIADILHDLGQHRVVHKDLKPANILIHPESQQIKLIDFSIASLLPRETQEIQSPNVLEGTLAYIAPEQTGRMNRGIDYRTDFYALGVTLYQLLTGTLPFESDDTLELLHCHLARVPVPVHQVNPGIPVMVAAIVAKLMAKNAEDRYQSALGLKHDLTQCLTQWQVMGAIAHFSLGQRDVRDRFLIPEKLYGRDSEVQALLAAFERVAMGSSELMLVAGFSGIGKTAVINEVHKPIVRKRGYFAKGKFDQFNRDIPLSAFVQALRDLMGQLLAESDAQLVEWQAKILAAVGDNGQVLVEVIPELEQIIGQQPAAPELSGSAVQNRFNLLFQKFIQVFTTAEHPLVIFLDDLQWADLASLHLIKLLMQDSNYLLMLCAYRDNEVSPAHPFSLTIAELKKAQATVHAITLGPLALDDTNQLIADTLNCSKQLAQPLTELIDRKTQGNPFFTTQFLKALYEDGQIAFDYRLHYWTCDIAQVTALALTDDVLEFMALQLQKLPPETQRILKLAACVGNQFDLETLAIVSEQSLTDAALALWQGLQEGLILPTNQIYKFFQAGEPEQFSGSKPLNPTYRFLHDRIQQAAYSLIPTAERETMHGQIGQLLLHHFSAGTREERIFEIVGHLNTGSRLLVHPQERLELAQLNLLAGRKAIAATAYGAALTYLNQGIDLLPEPAWSDQYPLTLDLHHHRLDVAFLNGKFTELNDWGDQVLQQATSVLDCIKVYETRMMALRAQGRFLEVVETGRQVLKRLGIEFPEQPSPADIDAAYQRSRQVWQGHTPLDLLDLPLMQDPHLLAAMQIMTKLVPSAHIAAPPLLPLLSFKQIELSIQHGNCPVSIFSYADYGLILCGVIGDIPTGHAFGQLSLALLDKLQANSFKSRAYFIVNSFTRHWQEPLQAVIPMLKEGYRCGLESGDWECVGLNILTYSHYQLWAGQELRGLADEMIAYHQAIRDVKQTATLTSHQAYLQTVWNLLGQAEVSHRLRGAFFDAEQIIPDLQSTNDRVGLFHVYLNQALLSYWFEQTEQAVQLSARLEEYSDAIVGFFLMPVWVFYDALIQLRRYADADAEQQRWILERVAAQQAKLRDWATQAPANHQHRWQLIAAETFRVLNQIADAIEHYDLAIASAQAHGFLHEEAIANELAARFYLGWGKPKIAQDYLTNAYYGYARWGAKAKVQDLERRYSGLLMPIFKDQQVALSATETLFASELVSGLPSTTTQTSTSGSSSISATLDLATILKAFQTLSSEIQLDKLLATLLHTVLENAGADRGVLLMPKQDHWFIEAVATINQPATLESTSLSSSQEVPHSLINSVKRSLQPMVIIDAAAHPALAAEAYVARSQPRSILCTPILQQGKLTAILYLENHLTTGAFTRDRVELLNFLCSQAAISLENAHLYQQVVQKSQELEQVLNDLQTTQLQMVQSEKMASLGNLVAGVAHEINNPIGFLNGSINNARETVQDLFDHLALYQQHHPQAAAPVQEHAEDIDLEFLLEDLPKLLNSMKGATDRIRSISTSLRTFSRADSEFKVPANLHQGLDSTLLILKYRLKANDQRPAIEVIQDYGQVPEIQCFPGQLNQVFMNILANAIDVFDEVAQQSSFAEMQTQAQTITIQTELTAADAVEIRIRDNGKGIPAAIKDRIFDHLFTTKGVGRGTGLGLAIARQIVVEKHGGSLEVQSEPGQGTEFCIRLPIGS